MYSLSTCWNSHRHTDGRAMLQEIRELGFTHAELSHGIRISLLPGIIEAVEARDIQISTLHNFCPLPVGVNRAAPNIFQFTASEQRERDNAFRYTVRTLETAARLGAKLVVLHLGSIRMRNYSHKLLEIIDRNKRNSRKYNMLCVQAIEARERKKASCIERCNEVLRRVAEEATKHGLKLGVENREGLEEIPLESDFPGLLDQFSGGPVGYWHDTGHAQIKENLGFIQHVRQLESMAERLLGFHIHDVLYPAWDHRAPGHGTIDFEALKPWVKPHHIKVFEIHPAVQKEELKQGVAWLKELWGDE